MASRSAATSGGIIKPSSKIISPGPFLKWAGGKSQLLNAITQSAPLAFDRYFEPFVGGGAVFFRLKSENPGLEAQLSDSNADLINAYAAVRDTPEELFEVLAQHRKRHCEEYFYMVRAYEAASLSPVEQAARIIYLNKTCFNGLYRVNRSGRFNVPYGRYANPKIFDESSLRAASLALKQTKLKCCTFDEAVRTAREGDFVYFDPPYQPLNATSNFTSYTSAAFCQNSQALLKEVFDDLTRRNVRALLSNSDSPLIRRLYRGYNVRVVQAIRAINSNAEKRGKVNELLVSNYQPGR